jgi:hypothetical protein
MTTNRTVTATFDLIPPELSQRTLTVTKTGAGSGTVKGTGITCPDDCTHSDTAGTAVTLTATASAESFFAGWSGGGCSGTNNTCTVTLNNDTTVTATFTRSPDSGKRENDLNGDGKADIVWRDTSTGDVAGWLGNGLALGPTGVIAAGVPAEWVIKGVGDLSGDGKADLVWRNTSTGDVGGWLMNGLTLGPTGVIAGGVALEWEIQP